MVPKIIHFCWFGGNLISEEYKKYMETWKTYCPDYEIKEWTEDNFDVNENTYCREAYEAKKWAFVSDYARLKIIYEYGGIYLDSDVELLMSLDPLLKDGKGFIGFQDEYQVNTGIGFAAPPKDPVIKSMLDVYGNRHFKMDDGSFDITPCPASNTVPLIEQGLVIGKDSQKHIQQVGNIIVYPSNYFCPISWDDTKHIKLTDTTYSIHHFSSSWMDEKASFRQKIKKMTPKSIRKKHTEKVILSNFAHIRGIVNDSLEKEFA